MHSITVAYFVLFLFLNGRYLGGDGGREQILVHSKRAEIFASYPLSLRTRSIPHCLRPKPECPLATVDKRSLHGWTQRYRPLTVVLKTVHLHLEKGGNRTQTHFCLY